MVYRNYRGNKEELILSFEEKDFEERERQSVQIGLFLWTFIVLTCLLVSSPILVASLLGRMVIWNCVLCLLFFIAFSRKSIPETRLVNVFSNGIEFVLGPTSIRIGWKKTYLPFQRVRRIKHWGPCELRLYIFAPGRGYYSLYSPEYHQGIIDTYKNFKKEEK